MLNLFLVVCFASSGEIHCCAVLTAVAHGLLNSLPETPDARDTSMDVDVLSHELGSEHERNVRMYSSLSVNSFSYLAMCA